MNSWLELLSLALTIPTLFLAGLVVWRYFPSIRKLIRAKGRVQPRDLLISGIVISFMGAIADNIYWGIAWTCAYFDLPQKSWWFANGIWSNVPFRQGAGIIAAFLHLSAALTWLQSKRIFLLSALLFLATLGAYLLSGRLIS